MAPRAGGIGKAFLKWAVIPIGLAALGFYMIGPKVANAYIVRLQNRALEPKEPAVGEAQPRKFSGEPKVEISASKVSPSPTPRRRTGPRRSSVRVQEPERDESGMPSPEPEVDPNGESPP